LAAVLNSVNVVRFITGARVVTVAITAELDVIVQVAPDEVHRLVDLDRLWEFSVGFQVSRFICRVLQDDIRFGILKRSNKLSADLSH
jgi:hypothetical protein